METAHLPASFSPKPQSNFRTPVVSQPAPKEPRLGFGRVPLHIRSRRYRNGFAWRLTSKTVLHHRPTAAKKGRGEKKKNNPPGQHIVNEMPYDWKIAEALVSKAREGKGLMKNLFGDLVV